MLGLCQAVRLGALQVSARVYTDSQLSSLHNMTGEWAAGRQYMYADLRQFMPALVERELQDWAITSFVTRLTPEGLEEQYRTRNDFRLTGRRE